MQRECAEMIESASNMQDPFTNQLAIDGHSFAQQHVEILQTQVSKAE